MTINKYFISMIILFMSGCATPLSFIPDEAGEQGLLVAQVITDLAPEMKDGHLVIDGVRYFGSMKNGNIIISLAPGEYAQPSLQKHIGSTYHHGYGGGGYTEHTYKPVFIFRKFTIEAGKATNMGVILIDEPIETRLGPTHFTYFADNSVEMSNLLKDRRPSLYESLVGEKMNLVNGDGFLDKHKLTEFRRKLVKKRLSVGDEGNRGKYIGAPLGALAELSIDKSGDVIVSDIVDTGTVADLTQCSSDHQRAACVIDSEVYLLVVNGNVYKKKMKSNVKLNSIYVVKNKGLVVVDDSMQVYTSMDNGESWRLYAEAVLSRPVNRDVYDLLAMNSFTFHSGENGFYIYGDGMAADEVSLLYSEYSNVVFRKIPLPKKLKELRVVSEKVNGLYIGPSVKQRNGKLYFLPKDSMQWQAREIPGLWCSEVIFGDQQGDYLEVLCEDDTVFTSSDGGGTWQRIFKAKSLFYSFNGQA